MLREDSERKGTPSERVPLKPRRDRLNDPEEYTPSSSSAVSAIGMSEDRATARKKEQQRQYADQLREQQYNKERTNLSNPGHLSGRHRALPSPVSYDQNPNTLNYDGRTADGLAATRGSSTGVVPLSSGTDGSGTMPMPTMPSSSRVSGYSDRSEPGGLLGGLGGGRMDDR